MTPHLNRVLIIDDDIEDQLLIRSAFKECETQCALEILGGGETAIARLLAIATGEDANAAPNLILLDLNMPRMSGKEVLAELYQDAHLRAIPVVVFTTSSAADDIGTCYDLGARSYIQKPSTFSGIKKAITLVARYWLDTVQLPRKGHT